MMSELTEGEENRSVTIELWNERRNEYMFSRKVSFSELHKWLEQSHGNNPHLRKRGDAMKQEPIKHWFRDLPNAGNVPVNAMEWERAARNIQGYLENIKIAIARMRDCERKLIIDLSDDWTQEEVDAAMVDKYCKIDVVFSAAIHVRPNN